MVLITIDKIIFELQNKQTIAGTLNIVHAILNTNTNKILRGKL